MRRLNLPTMWPLMGLAMVVFCWLFTGFDHYIGDHEAGES